MFGKEAAMACTVAVEESITEHYNKFVAMVVSRRLLTASLSMLSIRALKVRQPARKKVLTH